MKKLKFLLGFSIMFILLIFGVRFVYSVEKVPINENLENTNTLKINKYPLNIDEILYNNSKDILEEELVLEEIDLEYSTVYKENEDLPTGTIHIIQMGNSGKQEARSSQ